MKQIKDKSNRKQIIKNVLFYISLGFNALFLTIGIVGCSISSSKTDDHNAASNNQIAKLRNEKSIINSDDYYNAVFGFDINNIKSDYQPTADLELDDFFVSLGSTQSAVVRTSNDSLAMLDESWYIYAEINSPLSAGNDYIQIETPNWTRRYEYRGSYWYTIVQSPENYIYNQLYLPVTQGYQASGFDTFKSLCKQWFKEVLYNDIQLKSTWNPQYMVSLNNPYIFINSHASNGLTLVNNAYYGNSFYLLEDTCFSVNGWIYTDLLCHCQILEGAYQLDVYKTNYVDHKTATGTPNTYQFMDFVYAYNRASGRSNVLWKLSYEDLTDGSINHYVIYEQDSGFRNSNFTAIRLFDRHLDRVVEHNYTNQNVLLQNDMGYVVDDVVDNYGEVAGLNNVFDLFTLTFNGLQGLFSIQILPGLTIGILLFLPLVGIVVFALIKIIHK